MRKRHMGVLFMLFIVTSLLISGCNLPVSNQSSDEDAEDLAATYVAQTDMPQAGQTSNGTQADEEPTPSELPTETATITPSPTKTLTPTSEEPQVHVDVDTNCRSGPGDDYVIEGGLLVGEDAEVVGKWNVGDYWIIPNPGGRGECWLWGNYATLEGPTDDLPLYTQPPTPTPTFTPTPTVDWSGSWETQWDCGGGTWCISSISVTQSGNSASGSFVYGGTNYVMNGTLSADYLTWSGTSETASGAFPESFTLKMINDNQFIGNLDGTRAWCGYRTGSGAGHPSPCYGP